MEKGYESGRQLPITGDNQVLTPYQCQPMNPQQPIMYNMPPCQYQFVSDPLAELMYAQKASVKQRFELFEALSGCETENQYYISTVDNQGNKKYLFKAKESSSCCCRFFCSGANREFTLNLRKIFYTPKDKKRKRISQHSLDLSNAHVVVVTDQNYPVHLLVVEQEKLVKYQNHALYVTL